MPRSKQLPIRAALAAALIVFSGGQAILPVHGQPRAPVLHHKTYHLELEAYPAAPFPYFSKFGTVNLHVYSGGVSAESFWLSGFSRNGTKTVTIMNPVARMYTDMPLSEITSIVSSRSSNDPLAATPPPVEGPITGKVGGLRASRYRLMYGPSAWIDIWTTTDVPESAQLRAIVDSLVRGISPPTASVTHGIPGTPVYVELNFRRFKKVPFLRLKKLTWSNVGETDALKVGSYYMKAPLIDAVWR
jgi:hypothetical protein